LIDKQGWLHLTNAWLFLTMQAKTVPGIKENKFILNSAEVARFLLGAEGGKHAEGRGGAIDKELPVCAEGKGGAHHAEGAEGGVGTKGSEDAEGRSANFSRYEYRFLLLFFPLFECVGATHIVYRRADL
jgi:hypothetical protein